MISSRLMALVRCPDCGGRLQGQVPDLACGACARHFTGNADYLVLHPGVTFAEQTRYLDESLHADARHEHVTPPLLSAKIRNDILRAFLDLTPGDCCIDLGCGSGRTLVWNADRGADLVGIDVSPYFAREACDRVDLVLGDLRRLPFADGAFSKACALDVVEHVSREGLIEVLRETCRVMAPGGAVFVYSHVRKNSWIAGGLKTVNRFAAWLERRGLVDLARERLRKSDHLNPLADIPDLEQVVQAAGFRVEKIRYYTPLVGAVVENILVRMGEHWLAKRAASRAAATGRDVDANDAVREARTSAKARAKQGTAVRAALLLVTWTMKLDILLFSRVRSGPFFALLVKDDGSRHP